MKFFLLSFVALAAAQSPKVELKALTASSEDKARDAECAAAKKLEFASPSPVDTYWDDFSVGPIEMCVRVEVTNDEKFEACSNAQLEMTATVQTDAAVPIATLKVQTKFDPKPLGDTKVMVQCQTVLPCDFEFAPTATTFNSSKIVISGSVSEWSGGATSPVAKISARSSNLVVDGNAFEKIDLPTSEMRKPFRNPYTVIRRNAICDDADQKCTTKFTYDSNVVPTVTTKTIKFSTSGATLKVDCEAADGYRIDTAVAPGPCDPFAAADTPYDCSKMAITLLDGVSEESSAVQKFVLLSLLASFFV